MKRGIGVVTFLFLVGAVITSFGHDEIANAIVPGTNEIISVNNVNGQNGNVSSPSSGRMKISANGKYAIFSSHASNVVANDSNGFEDLFIRNLESGTTSQVNVSSSGVQANDQVSSYATSATQAISGNGRYVAFVSRSTNLIDGQSMTPNQVYMRDTKNNTTSVVTMDGFGVLGNGRSGSVGGVSNDGRFVMFGSTGETALISNGSSSGSYPILADLKDRSFTLLASAGGAGAAMSCDGSFMVLVSQLQITSEDTDSYGDVYLLDLRNGLTVNGITTSSNEAFVSDSSGISCSGDYIVFSTADPAFSGFPGNGKRHVYLHDRINDTTSIVDTSSAGVVGNKDVGLSAVDDKGNVAFMSHSSNLVTGISPPTSQVYLKHASNGQTELLSKSNTGSYANAGITGNISISSDGKKVLYGITSAVTNLVSSNGNGSVITSLTGL